MDILRGGQYGIYYCKKDKLNVKIQMSNILYIGTIVNRPRVLMFVTDEGIYESYGKLKEFEVNSSLTFKRCHRKYLVNLRRIKAVDVENRQIIFDNNKITPIECSRRNLTDVVRSWKML